jgi:protein SCO1/2
MAQRWIRVFWCFFSMLLAGTAVPASASQQKYQRSVENYVMPDVVMINQDGERVRLKKLLESDKPVLVDFIYGTCTTICPVLSAGFSNLQRKLGPEMDKVHLVSITIDPENDTPQILKDYLGRYRAKPGWDFLTGSRQDVNRVMNAFDSFFRDKMDHKPLTFIRSPEDGKWVRLYGLMSGKDFLAECEKVGVKLK